MSTLRTNALEGMDAKNSITIVAGAGNITTTNEQEGLVKIWVDLDGTGTIAIDDSLNCASATDNNTGNYTVTYTNNMASATYSPTGGGSNRRVIIFESRATSNTNIYSQDHNDGTNEADADPACFHICGDLT